jgi:hypothetical protein
MRLVMAMFFIPALGLVVAGCKNNKPFDGPTVEAFTGRVTQDGKPVTLPPNSGVQLKVILQEKATAFGIPLETDGTFKIGWMPIGKYAVFMESPPKGGKGPPGKQYIPAGLTIEAGKTEYTIELGKDWRP